MERLSDVFPKGCSAIGDTRQMHEQNRPWAIRILREAVQKRGSITICGLLGIMSGVQIGGTCDPFSSCCEKISSSHAFQIVMEGASFDLVEMCGKCLSEPVSGKRRMIGLSFQYRGIVLCFACHPIEPQSSEGISLTSRLKEIASHLRSSIE